MWEPDPNMLPLVANCYVGLMVLVLVGLGLSLLAAIGAWFLGGH